MNTQRNTTKLVIKALADTNLDVLIDRLVEITMKHDPTGFMFDTLLRGVVANVEITDEDMLRDAACHVLDIQPFEYARASARLCDSCIKVNIKYQCGVDENGIDLIYDRKEVTVQFKDAEQWGIDVLYI